VLAGLMQAHGDAHVLRPGKARTAEARRTRHRLGVMMAGRGLVGCPLSLGTGYQPLGVRLDEDDGRRVLRASASLGGRAGLALVIKAHLALNK
jgi:hypothetical protein